MFYKFDKTTLEFKPIKASKYIVGLFSVVGIVSIISFNKDSSKECIEYESDIIQYNKQDIFNQDTLKHFIESLNFNFPDIIYAQAVLETGNFSSKIFRENHNLFGMKQAKVRSTTALGTQYSHAYYNDWRMSVMDYALWYNKYMSRIKSKEQYYEFLGQYYAEDPNYVNKLKVIVNEIR